MGVYMIPADELVPMLEYFLQNTEGDVTAQAMADAWNVLSEQYGWGEYLEAYD
jgi:hypothetical protein